VRSRLIAGIFSIALVLLVVVGPLYLSEKLEAIETAQDGLTPTDQVISESNSSTIYTPYLETNSTNEGYFDIAGFDDISHIFYCASAIDHEGDVIYNANGYEDIYSCSDESWTGLVINLNVYLLIDLSDMIEKEITEVCLRMNYEGQYGLHSITVLGVNSDWVQLNQVHLWGPTPAYTSAGTTYYNLSLSLEDMITAESITGSDTHQLLRVSFNIYSYQIGTLIYHNFQMNPEYFQSEILTWDNTTITTYEPYYFTFSQYNVHKVMMGIGGVLIFIVALIVSPLPIGENFDRLFPVTGFNVRQSGRSSRPKYRKGRF